ncbi:MAG: 23S rRNA (adenine(2503)-C(2))-methyltransferase RlmN [Proteobacteria bacterium]|nr:23S rRNA (adenine(2503)-C(2))-methyltransferase RlmN [Pseudomonadota bacterium]MDA0975983.1 23S rRNA (adenine(2503)-C(2))-methyltransferase RlmN [Pseudomonadota bacterium]MDA1037215.1 23S rRNA (adenine(2503)-C(2))-methyltransferase RlmN [Pseudomonadota bacterium]
MSNKKVNLLGYSLKSLEDFFDSIEEPKFRAKQVIKWIHQKGVLDFDEMSDLNKNLREKLKSIALIKPPQIEEVHKSSEGTIKYLIKLKSGSMVEMVRIPEKKRITLCISSQAGCALQCTFCATGAQGFERNLSADEIIGQLWLANFSDKKNSPITNVVFMGMGEPLLNFIPVIESAKLMKEQLAYGLSRKRITISTSGITPQIDQLCNEIDVSLAISLHAPTDQLRDEIVPINKKYPISELINSCKKYLLNYDGKRSITIEYVLIDGVNDSEELAIKLAKLLSNISCKINLIPFNPFDGSNYRRSKQNNIEEFKKILMNKGFITTLRVTRGDQIDGACGQLVGKLKRSIKGKKLIPHKSI